MAWLSLVFSPGLSRVRLLGAPGSTVEPRGPHVRARRPHHGVQPPAESVFPHGVFGSATGGPLSSAAGVEGSVAGRQGALVVRRGVSTARAEGDERGGGGLLTPCPIRAPWGQLSAHNGTRVMSHRSKRRSRVCASAELGTLDTSPCRFPCWGGALAGRDVEHSGAGSAQGSARGPWSPLLGRRHPPWLMPPTTTLPDLTWWIRTTNPPPASGSSV